MASNFSVLEMDSLVVHGERADSATAEAGNPESWNDRHHADHRVLPARIHSGSGAATYHLSISETANGVRFAVRVQPRASKNEVAGIHGTALKIRLQAPPVDGAANDALVSFLADSLGVSRRSVRIISGDSSRNKTVEVDGVTAQLIHLLAEK